MSKPTHFGISDTDLNKITSLLRSIEGIEKAKIFGSRALGTYRDGSDIDIAVTAPAMDHTQFLRLATSLDDLMLPYKIDLIIMHHIANDALTEHIEKVGINLW